LPVSSPGRQGFSAERLERMRQTVRRFVDEGRHAGAVWLVARHGRIVDRGACGHRDLEQNLPMEPDTICRIYSMTKIVTSVAVLILVEEGRVGLNDPVGHFIPELKSPRVMTGGTADRPVLVAATGPITIQHLLTHTAGYTYDFSGQDPIHQLYQRANLWEAGSLKEFVRRVAGLPLKHQPGQEFTYGINADVLGYLVEVVAGKPFEVFLQERIFQPLKMDDTGFDVPEWKRGRLAALHKHDAAGRLVRADPILGAYAEPGRGIPAGGAGLFSTAGDFARFAQMLLNGGTLDGRHILGRKTVELMTQNFLAGLPRPTHPFSDAHGFGLGVEVRIDLARGGTPGSLGQFGWYGAATTYCNIDPKEKTVAILFCQHLPFNEHGIFSRFSTTWYQALVD
jgi:CubicO group peptidase (beta-lactamase class C family)